MNKKFSTLLAGMTLMSAMSVNAAPVAVEQGDNVLLKLDDSNYLTVQTGENFGKPATDATAPSNTSDLADLNQAMWNIIAGDTIQGKPVFTFVNKATNSLLAADPTLASTTAPTTAEDLTLGGSATQWTLEKSANGTEYLVSYFTGDSAVYLAKTAGGAWYWAKGDVDDIKGLSTNL